MAKLKNPHKNKARGNLVENEACKMLTKLLQDNGVFSQDECFYRTDGSGARRHVRGGVSKNLLTAMTSDIFGPEWFPISVEVKGRRNAPDFHRLLTGKHDLIDWCIQASNDASSIDKAPLVMVKYARVGWFVAIPFKILITNTSNDMDKTFENLITFYPNKDDIVQWTLLSWDSFVKILNFESLKNAKT